MTQRDRLAAVLHTDDTGGACWHAGTAKLCEMLADALFARGVRVVDAELLWRVAEPFSYHRSYPNGKRWTVCGGSGWDNDVVTLVDTEAEAVAAVRALNILRADLLAALDGEAER